MIVLAVSCISVFSIHVPCFPTIVFNLAHNWQVPEDCPLGCARPLQQAVQPHRACRRLPCHRDPLLARMRNGERLWIFHILIMSIDGKTWLPRSVVEIVNTMFRTACLLWFSLWLAPCPVAPLSQGSSEKIDSKLNSFHVEFFFEIIMEAAIRYEKAGVIGLVDNAGHLIFSQVASIPWSQVGLELTFFQRSSKWSFSMRCQDCFQSSVSTAKFWLV